MLYLQAAGRELRDDGQHRTTAPRRSWTRRATRPSAPASIIQRLRQLAEKRAPERRSIDLNAIVEDAVDLTLIGHDRSVRHDARLSARAACRSKSTRCRSSRWSSISSATRSRRCATAAEAEIVVVDGPGRPIRAAFGRGQRSGHSLRAVRRSVPGLQDRQSERDGTGAGDFADNRAEPWWRTAGRSRRRRPRCVLRGSAAAAGGPAN